jgi:hypothetical protein
MKPVVAGKTSKGNDFFKFELTQEEFQDGDDSFLGACVFCGEDVYNVEPDARKYECESCEKKGVYGLQELLLMGLIVLVD